MKNSLTDLFRERFQGHEAPVDPALWQVIEARVIASGPAQDPVNDLFRERFQAHEAEVDASVWDSINQQLHQPAGITSGISSHWGWWAAGAAGVAAVAITTALLWPSAPSNAEKPVAAQAMEMTAEPQAAVEPAGSTPLTEAETNSPVSGVPAPRSKRLNATPTSNPERLKETEPIVENPVQGDAMAEEPAIVEGIIEQITERAIQEALAKPDEQPVRKPEPQADPQATYPGAPQAPASAEPELFLPNAFTPNGDGFNDTYQIVPRSGTAFSSTLVRVYSMKTNQLVFSSSNLAEPWTGAGCEDGMYLVAVEAITLGGRVVADGKVVWLNRGSTN